MMQRVELFNTLPNEMLEQIFKLLGDEDLYFFARTGHSMFLIALDNLFWEHRVLHPLPIDNSLLMNIPQSQRFFTLYGMEKRYPNLNVHQIQCFEAVRTNNTATLQILQEHLTYDLCGVKNGKGKTFEDILKQHANETTRECVFNAMYFHFSNTQPINYYHRNALTTLGILLNRKEGCFAKLLATYAHYSDTEFHNFITLAIKEQAYHSLATMLGFVGQHSLPAICVEAAQYPSTDLMQLIIDYGVDVDQPASFNGTPLAAAAKHGNLSVMQLLLDHGADIDFGTVTPLNNAMEAGQLEAVKLLLAQGAAVNMAPRFAGKNNTYSKKISVLHAAASSNQVACAKILFEHCEQHAIKLNVNDLNEYRGTPLFVAASAGHVEMCQFLLEKGAAIETRYELQTPLYAAARNGHLAVVKLLCEHQAAIQHIGPESLSAIHAAAYNRHADVATYLCTLPHCDIDIATPRGKTALLLACDNSPSAHKNLPVIKVLLQSASVNIDYADTDGNTALHIAAEKGTREMLELLIQHKANVNVRNKRNWTPLHFLAERSNSSSRYSIQIDQNLCDRLAILITAGADPLARGAHVYSVVELVSNTVAYPKTIAYLEKVMSEAKANATSPKPRP